MTDVVILAKSFKDNGFCIAGFDLESGKWIRFVSDRNGAPILVFQAKYQNVEGFCAPLDVVRVEIVEKLPNRNHTEDCLISCTSLSKLGVYTLEQAMKKHPPEKHDYVFGDNASSLASIDDFSYSLMFIRVSGLTINYNRSKAEFDYNGSHYSNVSITDPDYTKQDSFLGGSIGLGNAYLVVSMPSKPYRRDGRYHKFIAKIFQA